MFRRSHAFVAVFLSGLTVSVASSDAQKMYWLSQGRVQRADLDGTNVEDVIVDEFSEPSSFAIDPTMGKMYWAEPAHRRIQRANFDVSEIEELVFTPFAIPKRIALDLTAGKLYWFESTLGPDPRVGRADLDGTNQESVLVIPGANFLALAVDPSGSKLYWYDAAIFRIQRADLDGTNVEDIVAIDESVPQDIAIDSQAEKIYWSDDFTVRRANLDGTALEVLVTGQDRITGLDLDLSAGKVIWASQTFQTTPDFVPYRIKRANLDGSDEETIVFGEFVEPRGAQPADIAINSAAGEMYWFEAVEHARIRKARLDGSEIETILTSRLSSPHGIALDLSRGFLYWSDRSFNADVAIWRAKLDGSEIEAIHSTAQTLAAAAIALDLLAEKMYWTELSTGMIRRSDLEGSNIEDLVVDAFVISQGLALDVAARKIYWTDVGILGPASIRRSNLDGTDVEVLITVNAADLNVIALDLTARKIYWTWNDGGSIQRANLDGTDIEDLVPVLSSVRNPTGLALDPFRGKMYWTENFFGPIHRANLDGTGIENLVSDGPRPLGIALDLGCGGVDCQPNGIGDDCEPDSDSDGVIDACDGCPVDPNKTAPGICGCGVSDDDSDSDTVADCEDECPEEDDTVDANGNGIPDCLDPPTIPTVSGWGLTVFALIMTVLAKIHFGRRRSVNSA